MTEQERLQQVAAENRLAAQGFEQCGWCNELFPTDGSGCTNDDCERLVEYIDTEEYEGE